jgi:hypothetical protein
MANLPERDAERMDEALTACAAGVRAGLPKGFGYVLVLVDTEGYPSVVGNAECPTLLITLKAVIENIEAGHAQAFVGEYRQ